MHALGTRCEGHLIFTCVPATAASFAHVMSSGQRRGVEASSTVSTASTSAREDDTAEDERRPLGGMNRYHVLPPISGDLSDE